MGPDPFCRVLMKKKISLCERNVGRPARRDIRTQKGVKGTVQVYSNLKIYYSYFIAVIKLRSYEAISCPFVSELTKWQGVNITTPLVTISPEKWSRAR